jgi:hypothetical protein
MTATPNDTENDGDPEFIPSATPEMIFAGAQAYLSLDRRFEDVGDAVQRIWGAMWRARSAAPDPALRRLLPDGEAKPESQYCE